MVCRVTGETVAGVNMTVGAGDYRFNINYYDFSKINHDFSAMPVYSQPTYVASPYGEWLSNTAASLTFSDWFTNKPATNHLIQRELVLKYNSTTQVNRCVYSWQDYKASVSNQRPRSTGASIVGGITRLQLALNDPCQQVCL